MQQQQFINFNQLNIFRTIISPILSRLFTACGIKHRRCRMLVNLDEVELARTG